jgi:O-antigen ligase
MPNPTVRDSPIIRHRNLPAVVGLALLVAWAPWPFGSVTAWAAAVLVLAAAVCLGVAALSVPATAGLRSVAVPALALAALAALGLLQSLPWPAAVAGVISPEHARLAGDAAQALGKAEEAVGWIPLSVAPAATRRSAAIFAGVAAAFAASALAARRRLGRRILGGAILGTAIAQILYGAPLWFARSRVLWGVEIPGSERLRGTFVNPNHLAVYLEIALAVAFAWGWWALGRLRREASAERRVLLVSGPALVWLTLFVGLAFTGSRAGLVAAGVGVAVQGGLAIGRRRRALLPVAGRTLGVVALLAVGFAAVVWIGAGEGLGRWQATGGDGAAQARLASYRDAAALWQRFPWLGTGVGTFLYAFPQVQSTTPELTWWHVHSDPLELLVVGGVVGAGVMLAGILVLVARLLRLLRKAERSEDAAAAVAALGALVAVGLHECVDFGLTVAANAFTLAILAGAAGGAAALPASSRHPDGRPRPQGSAPRGDAAPG